MSKFRRIAKIYFEGQAYQYYRNVETRKMAFLKYDEDTDTYHYPTVEEIIKLAYCFKNDGFYSFFKSYNKNKRHKLYRFAPKLILGTAVVSTSFLLGYAANNLNIDISYLKNAIDVEQNELNNSIEEPLEETYHVATSVDDNSNNDKQLGEITNDVLDNQNNQHSKSYIVQHSSDFFDIDEDIDKRTVDASDYVYQNGSTLVMVYNTETFKEFNVKTDYTYEDMAEVIDKSIRIDNEYKAVIKDFCKTMMDFYDDLDVTIFYNNLKMLKIEKISDSQLAERDSYAFYNSKENIIYVNNSINLEEDTLDIVIFRHELGHLFTESNFATANNVFMCNYAKYQDEGEYVKEGLNTILTTEPFLGRYSDQTEDNMGYALITNYLRTLIEIMPNFKIQQMTWGNYEYFEKKLDEAFDCNVDASTLISLLELQCNEYYNKGVKGTEKDYREIYEYLGIAYNNYFENQNTSDNEIQSFIDTIDNRLIQGVDDTSLIFTDVVTNEIKCYTSPTLKR